MSLPLIHANPSLCHHLRTLADQLLDNLGSQSLSATVRDLLRQQKSRQEAAAARAAILAGYQDAIEGRTHEFKGDLTGMLKKVK